MRVCVCVWVGESVCVCVCVCECEQLPVLSSENEEKIARAQAGTPAKHKQAVRMNNGVQPMYIMKTIRLIGKKLR